MSDTKRSWSVEKITSLLTKLLNKKLYTGADSNSTVHAITPASLYNLTDHAVCPYYSSASTYTIGEKVRYGDYIYECVNNIRTAQQWTPANWRAVPTLQEQIDEAMANNIVELTVAELQSM